MNEPACGTETAGGEGEKAEWGKLVDDWKTYLGKLLDDLEEFTRKRPKAGLSVAFVVGWLLGRTLFRR